MAPALGKVTAFVTRTTGTDRHELLVFRHPHAGVQLPAGTAEPGESAITAVLREVQEETGVMATEATLLTTTITALNDGQRAILDKATVCTGPGNDAEPLGIALRRGLPCRVVANVGQHAEIVFEELTDSQPPEVIRRFSGWVPRQVLASKLQRSFFQIRSREGSADQWNWFAEDRYSFQCYWVPLSPKPMLVKAQQVWVDDCYPDLLRRLAD